MAIKVKMTDHQLKIDKRDKEKEVKTDLFNEVKCTGTGDAVFAIIGIGREISGRSEN